MSWDLRDRKKCEASRTAVESLLRTLDDEAAWQDRSASRVRAFATARPCAGTRAELAPTSDAANAGMKPTG